MSRVASLYQQFDPMRPLTTANKVDIGLYVDWQQQLGIDDVKQRLIYPIARSRGQAVTHLLTGPRGVGKTTELYRVKRSLETGVEGRRLFVSMLQAGQWLDLADVQPEDLVFQIVRQLVTDLRDVGFELGAKKFGEVFRRLREEFNRETNLDMIEFGVDPLKFSFTLQDLPAARRQLRRLLQGQLPRIYDLVNDEILTKARKWLVEQREFDDILIIVDEIDRIPLMFLNDAGLTNHDNLFIGNAGTLRALDCDILYTIHMELAYGHHQAALLDMYGVQLLTLPVVPVIKRDGNKNVKGHEALAEIVRRRVSEAGLNVKEIFESGDLLDKVLLSSGGHIRTLFILLRSILDRVMELPISRPIVERSLRRAADDLARTLSHQDWELLKRVHETKRSVNGASNPAWNRLLRDFYALAYYDENVGFWYDWNPLLGYVDRRGGL
jgi:hypothetical protein